MRRLFFSFAFLSAIEYLCARVVEKSGIQRIRLSVSTDCRLVLIIVLFVRVLCLRGAFDGKSTETEY